MDLCKICKKEKTLFNKDFCSITCFNVSRTKDIDGYKKCNFCGTEFPFRKTLLVRGLFSKKYNCMIGSVKQKYCSLSCSLKDRNTNFNPAKTKEGRKKISISAIKRGVAHLLTKKAREKQRKTITGSGHWNWQGNKSHPNCVDCGKEISFRKKRCILCRSKYLSGERCHWWKGGITPESKKERKTLEYTSWRKAVFERDNYTCQRCGVRNGIGVKVFLHAHHIKPFYKYKKLRTKLSNGLTLCNGCHKKIHSKNNVVQLLSKDF